MKETWGCSAPEELASFSHVSSPFPGRHLAAGLGRIVRFATSVLVLIVRCAPGPATKKPREECSWWPAARAKSRAGGCSSDAGRRLAVEQPWPAARAALMAS